MEAVGGAVPKGLRSFVRVSRKTVLTMAKFGKDKKERIDKDLKSSSPLPDGPLTGFP